MLRGLVKAVKRLRGASQLDSYVTNLQRVNRSGAPTRDEAKRDYASAIRVATSFGHL